MSKFPSWAQPRLSLLAMCLWASAAGSAYAEPVPIACADGSTSRKHLPAESSCAAPPIVLDHSIFSFRTSSIERVSVTKGATRPFEYQVCVGKRCYQETEGIGAAVVTLRLLLSAPEAVIAGLVAPTLPTLVTLHADATLTLDADRATHYAGAKEAVRLAYSQQLAALGMIERVNVHYPGTGGTYTFWLEKFGPASGDFRLAAPSVPAPPLSAEILTQFIGPDFPNPLPGSELLALPKAAPAVVPPLSVAWGAIFGSPDPVAEVLRLHAARVPGSFAMASKLAVACNVAWLHANAYIADAAPLMDAMAGAANPPAQAQRLQAKDKIARRCAGMRQHEGIYEPLPDDQNGLDWKAVQRPELVLVEAGSRFVARELARQGSLPYLLSFAPVWNGQILNSDLHHSAMGLAALLATAVPSGGADDIRLLTACVQHGHCTDDYIEYWFMGHRVDAANRRQFEALAQEMAAAMRVGDYEKFLH